MLLPELGEKTVTPLGYITILRIPGGGSCRMLLRGKGREREG